MGQPTQQTIIIQPKVSKVLRLRNLHFMYINSHILKHSGYIIRNSLRAQKSNSSIDWIISEDQIEEQILEGDRQFLPSKKMNTTFQVSELLG